MNIQEIEEHFNKFKKSYVLDYDLPIDDKNLYVFISDYYFSCKRLLNKNQIKELKEKGVYAHVNSLTRSFMHPVTQEIITKQPITKITLKGLPSCELSNLFVGFYNEVMLEIEVNPAAFSDETIEKLKKVK